MAVGSGQVEAFRDAAMIFIELQCFRPKKETTAILLKPAVSSGGRPAYTLLQLYHSMCLKLGHYKTTFTFIGHALLTAAVWKVKVSKQ